MYYIIFIIPFRTRVKENTILTVHDINPER